MYAIALSRLGISYDDFLDVTPKELSLALDDHQGYHNLYTRQLTELVRYVGAVLRNKGVKQKDQVRDVHRFFELFWDKKKEVDIPNWKEIDRKYGRRPKKG